MYMVFNLIYIKKPHQGRENEVKQGWHMVSILPPLLMLCEGSPNNRGDK